MIPMVVGQADIPTFQQEMNTTLSVPCFINGDICGGSVICDASVVNPSGNETFNTEAMFQDGSFFKLNMTESDTSQVGQYELSVSCCQGGNCFDRQLNFQITPSGAQPLSTSQGTVLLLVLGVILFISIIFFIIGFRGENVIVKTTGFAGGVITIFILVLYTMFIINEAVSGTPNLVQGYETFLLVMKSIGTVLILGLIVVLFLVMAKAWRIKRGLIDK